MSGVRLAPDSSQKMNAYLLNKTTNAAADLACENDADEKLCRLTTLAAMQSEAVVEYYGKPEEVADVTVDQLLGEQVYSISQTAYKNANTSNKPAVAVNDFLDLAIGLCGLFGGAFGIKAVAFLSAAKMKTKALEEIIQGNEKFKSAYPEYSDLFKKSQSQQSQATKGIVTGIKNTN